MIRSIVWFWLVLSVVSIARPACGQTAAAATAAPDAATAPIAQAADAPASTTKADAEAPQQVATAPVAADAERKSGAPAPTPSPIAPAATETDGSNVEGASDAERIARLESEIDADENRLQQLQQSLTAPDGEYARAEAAFREVDAMRTARRKALSEANEAGPTQTWARLKDSLAALEKKRQLAKERFELAIEERKASQESVATLERKLQSQRETLARLRGIEKPSKPDAAPAPAAAASLPAAAPVAPAEVAQPAGVAADPPVPPTPAAIAAQAVASDSPDRPESASVSLVDATPLARLRIAPAVSQRLAAELAAARSMARQSSDSATAAEATVQALNDRIQILQEDIRQQRELRETARRKVDNAEKTLEALNDEVFRKLLRGADITKLQGQVRETVSRMIESRERSRQIATHLDDLQSTLVLLQAEQHAAARDATAKRQAAELAQAQVSDLENPFAIRNVLRWLLDHGPRIVVILVSLSLFLWLTRVLESRLVGLIARRGRHGSREDRENRAKTLLGVFNNVANLLFVSAAAVMLLDEVGIPITPVIGGAAVLGLAVAFGAQSLIKDYFTGFMVLFEQQYLINDVVKIGEITGQVERITLRMTVLRDMEGRVHFIPHGQINTVTNLTHGWSRAVFEVNVAYKERVDQVIEVLQRLAGELRQDENYRYLILEDPVMLGVDSLASSAVVIKFYIQTRPLQKWTVKREMLRRIKNEFDRIGIQIPFPHVMVYQGQPPALASRDEPSAEPWDRRDAA